MSSLKTLAESVLHGLGAMHLVRAGKKNQCRILMYHGFQDNRDEIQRRVTRQCEHLRRYYRPISLGEIADALRKNIELPPNGVAITVDDGYRDLQLVFPIFRSFGLNVTVYAVSDFAEGRIWLWPDQLRFALFQTSRGETTIRLRQGESRRFQTETPEQKAQTFIELAQAMTRLPNRDRLSILTSLPECLGVEMPVQPPSEYKALSWPELRIMAAEGLEVGAHTRTHPILSNLESVEQMHSEIAGSKRRIEEAMGVPVRHFCYPNGQREDYNADAVQMVREAGYETAVTTEPGLVKKGADPFQLNRLPVGPDYEDFFFERCVAGYRR